MKIVATYHEDEILMGLAATFTALGHQFLFWRPDQKPTFDMFEEVRPDIFILQRKDICPTLWPAIEEYKPKTIRFGEPALPIFDVDLTCNRDGTDAEQENSLSISLAANLAKFCNGKHVHEYESNFFYLSDAKWEGGCIPNILTQFLDEKLKIVGPVPLQFPNYLGNASLQGLNNLIKSTKVAIDFHNKHYLDYSINKVYCISYWTNAPETYNNELVEEAKKVLVSPKLRKKEANYMFENARNHTYFHRASCIFDALGYNTEAKASLDKVEEMLRD